MAINLLACLLARAFSPSQATAIWVELVIERKREVESDSDDSQFQSLAARAACRQDLSRDELAKWDASARAWLLSADEVKRLQITQFKLIVKDLGLFTSSVGGTYASIMDVWTTAMRSMQDLIDGKPQRITKGALLLGISAWHIYPDLNVIGPTAHVRFKDPLVNPGGIITIGLSASEDDSGAKWSLSLSHLRYYGDPVTVSMPAEPDSSRITMEELHLVALGSLMGSWGKHSTGDENGAGLLIALKDCLEKLYLARKMDLSWLEPLSTAAQNFLDSQGTQRDEALHLIAYGRRKGQNFLRETQGGFTVSDHIFTLDDSVDLATFLTKALLDDDVFDEEQCIEDFRHLASRWGFSHHQCVIRYRRKASSVLNSRTGRRYGYATAIPIPRISQELGSEGAEQTAAFHERWLEAENISSDQTPVNERCHHVDHADTYISDYEGKPRLVWNHPPGLFSKHLGSRPKYGKDVVQFNEEDQNDNVTKDLNTTSNDELVIFDCIAGRTEKAALFRVTQISSSKNCFLTDVDITKFLRSRNTNPQQVINLLNLNTHLKGKFLGSSIVNLIEVDKMGRTIGITLSLVALGHATNIYKQLSGATVSITVVNQPLHCANWIPIPLKNFTKISRAAQFACIAMFETGTLNLEPGALSTVMAISSGNSIYVANQLIHDRSGPGKFGITRILGNLGRPGVVMLVPPEAPRVSAVDPKNWRLVNHHLFDGAAVDSFTDTSLHLSCTEYEVPLAVPIGAIDADAVMLETLISVYDRQKWIADLDILGCLEKQDPLKVPLLYYYVASMAVRVNRL